MCPGCLSRTPSATGLASSPARCASRWRSSCCNASICQAVASTKTAAEEQVVQLQPVDAAQGDARLLEGLHRVLEGVVAHLEKAVHDRDVAKGPARDDGCPGRRAQRLDDRETLRTRCLAVAKAVLLGKDAGRGAHAHGEADRRRFRRVALGPQVLERRHGAGGDLLALLEAAQVAQRERIAHLGQGAIASRRGRTQRLRQAGVVVQRALRQVGDDVQAADRLQLEIEVLQQEDDELLRLPARALGELARCCACASASRARFMFM